MPSFFDVDRRSKCGILICKAACRLTRTIFYLRCAIYCCLLPRTHPQQHQLWAQTHSRRRSYARSDDGNRPTALHWTFSFFFFPSTLWLHYATRAMSVIDSLCCTHKIYMPLHNVNGKIGASFLNKRLSERPIFAEFCARGRRPASIGAGSERDKTAAK